ncbi:MAG: sulfite reductase subunit alpha [Xanthobacteraceae bacterium]|nr:sulfite reductase subunit alpha [Xanthobacteraceae bacterium]
MNQTTPLTRLQVVPEGAPFTDAQRAWLNGFLVGALQLDGNVALSPEQSAAIVGDLAAADDDDDAPWHDQTMPIADRMKLAEGKPLRRRMMAAMAQQDCGQCGYNCRDYADALAARTEERVNLCVPGGKDTARMLKALHAERDAAPAAKAAPDLAASAAPASAPGRSRDNPAMARLLSRRLLNKPGSEKETWHIEFDLTQGDLDYVVGDSFGVFPRNDLGLVDQVIAVLGASHATQVNGKALRDVLRDDVSLSPSPDKLFELLSFVSGGALREKARVLAQGGDPDGDAAHLDVLATLQKFMGVRPHPEAFVEALDPLQPRLYSISSSHNAAPGRLSLTVDTVRYLIGRRGRLGVASTYLAERAAIGDDIRVYVQKAHGFALPASGDTPVIMIGPGTGVAPFRAFLQDRGATGARGRNWLFFGHQRRDCDFFYEHELNAMKGAGLLTRLSLAWSRDDEKKFYVQDRMREVGHELWNWLADGAHLYVCGDAKRMGKDVERALVDIVAQFGMRSTDEAVAFVADLKRKGRYQQDVY